MQINFMRFYNYAKNVEFSVLMKVNVLWGYFDVPIEFNFHMRLIFQWDCEFIVRLFNVIRCSMGLSPSTSLLKLNTINML